METLLKARSRLLSSVFFEQSSFMYLKCKTSKGFLQLFTTFLVTLFATLSLYFYLCFTRICSFLAILFVTVDAQHAPQSDV